tara:strand:+ start:1335 stop:1544 length:210 start_codon:yes stop_codon:yes gene_type:complete
MRGRAWRRKQEFKKKRDVFKTYYKWWRGDRSPRIIGIRSHTPTLCSCWMCGNPRKYFNAKTIQEMKNEL